MVRAESVHWDGTSRRDDVLLSYRRHNPLLSSQLHIVQVPDAPARTLPTGTI